MTCLWFPTATTMLSLQRRGFHHVPTLLRRRRRRRRRRAGVKNPPWWSQALALWAGHSEKTNTDKNLGTSCEVINYLCNWTCEESQRKLSLWQTLRYDKLCGLIPFKWFTQFHPPRIALFFLVQRRKIMVEQLVQERKRGTNEYVERV